MFAVSLFLAGTGIGVLITVASSTIISNVSADRAGMASGVEEVSYEFGSLIAVALLGSLLGALYSMGISLPPGTPEAPHAHTRMPM